MHSCFSCGMIEGTSYLTVKVAFCCLSVSLVLSSPLSCPRFVAQRIVVYLVSLLSCPLLRIVLYLQLNRLLSLLSLCCHVLSFVLSYICGSMEYCLFCLLAVLSYLLPRPRFEAQWTGVSIVSLQSCPLICCVLDLQISNQLSLLSPWFISSSLFCPR